MSEPIEKGNEGELLQQYAAALTHEILEKCPASTSSEGISHLDLVRSVNEGRSRILSSQLIDQLVKNGFVEQSEDDHLKRTLAGDNLLTDLNEEPDDAQTPDTK